MAIIDYHSIKSLIFAKLSRSSRILIPVLSCLCDDWDGSLSREHSKHHILAMYSGLSIASIKRALKELKEKGIISIETQSGKPASIQYIPQLNLSAKTQKGSSQRPTSEQEVAHDELPLLEKIPPQTPPDKEPEADGMSFAPNDSSLFNKQQPKILAITDLVGHTLVKQKIGEKGSAFVVGVLKAMSGRNGEIQDPPAYFVSCCSKDVIPWTRAQKAEARATQKRQRRELYQEAADQRWERERQSVITEQNDPEVQARVQAIQATFLESMGEPEVVHNPPA